MEYIGHFLLVGVVFAAIDAVWLGVVANKFYKSRMGNLLMDKPNFGPAVIFYVIYIAAIVVLALEPALRDGEVTTALGMGAMFGFAAYATYDLTNAATVKGWSKSVTIVDLIWGTTVTALTTVIAFLILS